MKILVCVKQVPDTAEIKIDPVTNTLIRAGVPSIVNPFDACALEVAARIKDADPSTEITLLSMGPDQAKDALRECLAVGGDKAYLCSDRKFGGSDTLATSYILASAIQSIEEKEGKFDLILAGKQAIDGDTGQVGPEIAAHMGLAQVTYAAEVSVEGDDIIVKRESDKGYDMISVQKPAIVTVMILKGVGTYNEYYNASLYLSDPKLKTIAISLYTFVGPLGSKYNLICAGVIISLIPALVVFLIFQKQIYSGLTAGAVKG